MVTRTMSYRVLYHQHVKHVIQCRFHRFAIHMWSQWSQLRCLEETTCRSGGQTLLGGLPFQARIRQQGPLTGFRRICHKRPFSYATTSGGNCARFGLAESREEKTRQLTFWGGCSVWPHSCRALPLSAHRFSDAGKVEGDDDLQLLQLQRSPLAEKECKDIH